MINEYETRKFCEKSRKTLLNLIFVFLNICFIFIFVLVFIFYLKYGGVRIFFRVDNPRVKTWLK
jgi:hypothetical protein